MPSTRKVEARKVRRPMRQSRGRRVIHSCANRIRVSDRQHQRRRWRSAARFALPGRLPQRFGFRRRGEAEGGGQVVGQGDGQRDLVAVGGGAGGADLDGQGLGRVDLGRQGEEADFLHRRGVGQGQRLQHLVAVVGGLPADIALHHGRGGRRRRSSSSRCRGATAGPGHDDQRQHPPGRRGCRWRG